MIFILILSVLHFHLCSALADWTVVLFLQAHGSLQEPAQRALQALSEGLNKNKSSDIQVVVEVIADEDVTLYHIDNYGIHHEILEQNGIYETCLRAFSRYPSKNTMIIFSAHGSGILEPYWDQAHGVWCYDQDKGYSYYCGYRLRQSEQFFERVTRLCDHKAPLLAADKYVTLTASKLAANLQKLNGAIGGKIDIIGFDMCHMAMLEIAYELRNYAQIMVASQDCEEKNGWDYGALIDILATSGGLDKKDESATYHANCDYTRIVSVARRMVYAYEKMQVRAEHPVFSLSAFDLEYTDKLVRSLDVIVESLESCLKHYGNEFHDMLCGVRQRNVQFCTWSNYADLMIFLRTLLHETSASMTSDKLEALNKAAHDTIELLSMMTLANIAGEVCYAQGCSIYFPYAHIDSSYQRAAFAQTHWPLFLKRFIG